jgi:ATP-dependent RNA helicase RhlE
MADCHGGRTSSVPARKKRSEVNLNSNATRPSEPAARLMVDPDSPFAQLGLADPILRALAAEGYTTPTPIQAEAIPHLLRGRDLLGCARTGTGKTAAFALPILDRLARMPRPARPTTRVLALTPTRELALQVSQSFATYGKFLSLRTAAVFGGVGQGPQVAAFRGGAEIIVATPGRLLDLMEQRHARLEGIEVLILDEADRMLDMGFIQPLRRILAALPRKRQNLLFSATMPREVAVLAEGILVDPARVSVDPVSTTAVKISQRVHFIDRGHKPALLRHVLGNPEASRVLVFTRTKHGANRVSEQLGRAGISSAAIHGNKTQGARQRALEDFRKSRVQVLVATDIAARGIDVDGVTHVINLDLPMEPESYVHRIGRTARAGAAGIALSFCDASERSQLRAIERLTGVRLEVAQNPDLPNLPPGPAPLERGDRPQGRSQRPFGGGGGRGNNARRR